MNDFDLWLACLMVRKWPRFAGSSISRARPYKIFNRYKDIGLEGLTDRTRRPMRYANQLPFQQEKIEVRVFEEDAHAFAPMVFVAGGAMWV